MGWLASLLGLIDPITRIAGKIADARIASVQATTDKERIHQEERIKALEARQAVLVAASTNSKWDALMRFIMAVPVAAFLWKVIMWDKVLAFGSTDDLSENLWYVTMMVLGFYYVHWTVGAWKR